MKLENIIDSLLGKDIFIVSMNEVLRQNSVRLIVDAERHISLDKTAEIAKKIRDSKEMRALFPDGVRIEVSTPGVTAPLEYMYQYRKNIGRKLNILIQGELKKNIQGILKEVKTEGIHIISHGKKIQFYPFNEIRKATVQVSF